MITSERKFGVEIEFYAPDEASYFRVMKKLQTKRDGSLDGRQYGSEYVSPVLSGANGERTFRGHCEVLKQYKCDASDQRASVHIHLDGMRDEYKIVEHKNREGLDGQSIIAISPRVYKEVGDAGARMLTTNGGLLLNQLIKQSVLDNVIYFAFTKITKHPKLNYKYYTVSNLDRTKWLRNVFYFYTQYSNVMESLVSNSRKYGNMYCLPLGSCYGLDEIEKCETKDDLYKLWYRGNLPEGHYDNSRYHNVNLHSFFDGRTGTIEIRSHGGTINADKILLWVRLHQFILDKLEDMELEDVKMKNANEFQSFIDFISDDPLLVDYVKRLVGYFSGIRI